MVLSGETVLHELMYYSSLIINLVGFIIIASLSSVLTFKLMQKAAESQQRSTSMQSNKSRSFNRKISMMLIAKRPRGNHQSEKAVHTAIERKLKTATRLSLMFALNYILCYILDVMYYALPGLRLFHNISEALKWLTGCDATLEVYLRFWYYYSVALSSLINALIHLVVNDIVKDHMRVLKVFYRSKLRVIKKITLRKMPSAETDTDSRELRRIDESLLKETFELSGVQNGT